MTETITATELAARLSSDEGRWPNRSWALLDVREAGEADRGHIPGATALPRRQLEFRLPNLVPARDTAIVLYDGDDGRAALAAETCLRHGWTEVTIVTGGAPAWQAAGHSLATGNNVPSKDFGEKVHVTTDVPELTAEELKARLDAGARLAVCDVRTPEEFAAGCIPGAVSAPSFELALNLADLSESYEGVVVNCAGRTRSIIGAETLRRLGGKKIWALKNGTMGWRLAGLELERRAARSLQGASTESRRQVSERARALAADAGVEAITSERAHALLEGADRAPGVYLFDVRPVPTFVEGHLPGSVCVPGGQAVQRADDYAAVPGATIVFVDDGDARAWLTAYWYTQMGFPRVCVLDGGVAVWRDAGYPLVQGRDRPQPLGLAAAEKAVTACHPDSLAAWLERHPDTVVLDVGTSRQFAAGHLPQAHWLPRGWLELRIGALVGGKSRPLAVTAQRESQATLAAATLGELGYTAVRTLAGGTAAWQAAGQELVQGLPEGVEAPGDLVEPPYHQGRAGMLRYLDWETRLGEKYQRGATPREGP